MRDDIAQRQAKAMVAAGLDAMISCSPENFAYVTGFVVPSQPLIRHRHAMAIVQANGTVALFGVDMESSTIARNAPGVSTTIWAEFSDDAMLVLAAQLAELGLARGRIGIELDYLPAGDFMRLQAALPGATTSASSSTLSACLAATAAARMGRTALAMAGATFATSLGPVGCSAPPNCVS
jgi:Xaa-Pro aminopeptidase